MEPLIICENLVKIYKVVDLEVVALQGLDLDVRPGELLAIVGASGSGKSTLLNILGGLDRPSAGRVTVNGRNLLKLSNRELDRYRRFEVGFVWQQTGRNLIPYLTARENVELPMTVAGMGLRAKRAWSQELLEMVDLWEHRWHRLAQLSGGQQQRVAIALALANKPKLLLGDEPTGLWKHVAMYQDGARYWPDSGVVGDIDGNGRINLIDLLLLARLGLAQEYVIHADLDYDEDIDLHDVRILAEFITGMRDEIPE